MGSIQKQSFHVANTVGGWLGSLKSQLNDGTYQLDPAVYPVRVWVMAIWEHTVVT